jgi:hypothetical protein
MSGQEGQKIGTSGNTIRAAQHGVQVMPLARLQTWRF